MSFAAQAWHPRRRNPTLNSNYNILRKDRRDGYGGSIILIKNTTKHERIEVDTPCDIVFVKVECANNESLTIGSAY